MGLASRSETDPLFFYVNDAVIGLPGIQPFYWDNKGYATFFVRPPLK